MDKALKNEILNITRNIVTAITNMTFYSAEHSQVKRHLDSTYTRISSLLKEHPEITFIIVEGDLIVDNHPMGTGILLSKFTEKIQRRGIGKLTFTAGLERAELADFISALVRPVDTGGEVPSLPHIQIGTVEIKLKDRVIHGKDGAEEEIGNVGDRALREFMMIYEEMEEHKKIDVVGLQEITANIIRALKFELDPLKILVPMRTFDEYTFTHSVNVCILTMSQAMRLRFEGQVLHDIGIAALLHDVGKLFIPEDILSKDTPLTEDEWQIIREHPVKGAIYLMDIAGVPGLCDIVAFEHHMRYDQGGYPDVRSVWKQNLCSQMTSISDVFDAARTYKRYRSALTDENVLSLIKQDSGTHFNPFLAENFIKMFPDIS